MNTPYRKLVRDNIPEIILQSGKHPNIRILDDNEYYEALKQKLQEELDEFFLTDDVIELVDIGEVMHAILAMKNVSIEEYQRLRQVKKSKNGAFDRRFFLESVDE